MFDVIEHVPDDARAMAEALRVLRPGGALLLSTPNADWRLPYHRFLRPISRPEEDLFAEWGHVRRGYTPERLDALVGRPAQRTRHVHQPGDGRVPRPLVLPPARARAPGLVLGDQPGDARGLRASTARLDGHRDRLSLAGRPRDVERLIPARFRNEGPGTGGPSVVHPWRCKMMWTILVIIVIVTGRDRVLHRRARPRVGVHDPLDACRSRGS